MTTPTTYGDIITSNQLPDAMRVVFSSMLEMTARSELIYDQDAFCETRDDFAAKHGEQVTWTMYHQLAPAIAPLGQNTDVVGGQISDHQYSFKVYEYGDAQGTTEYLDLLSYHGPISNIIRTLLGPQVSLTFDTIARNTLWYAPNRALLDNTQVGAKFHYYMGNGINSRATMTPDASIMTAAAAKVAAHHLTVRRVPPIGGQDPSYVCLTHPSITYDLKEDPFWKDAQLYAGGTRIFNGEEGMLHGVRFVKSDRARIANGGTVVSQTGILSTGTQNQNQLSVTDASLFHVGDEVTLHNVGVATTANNTVGTPTTWYAPDGQDPTHEDVIIKSITGSGPYIVTFTNPFTIQHNPGDYMTEGLDVYPMVFMGGQAALGKGRVVAPEVRVSLPTDKLRRVNYVGWYALQGFGVVRENAYEVVEALATQNVPSVYSF